MEPLKQAVRTYAARHANHDGLALTPVPGLRMMCVAEPRGAMHSIYRPLVCLVLQGAKHMTIGTQERVLSAGKSVVVSMDLPVTGQIVQATASEPYIAIAVELEITLLREITAQLGGVRVPHSSDTRSLFVHDTDAAGLDCAMRLVRLLDRPEATPLLGPGIMRELHYWLLSGQHGPALQALADPDSHASRLAAAIATLRTEYRTRIPVERLAAAVAMSLTAFHKHFRQMTSLTPGQYQKRLRLIEARRLMMEGGFSATQAAFEVGYESISQFTREYGRLFGAPPKRHALRGRSESGSPKTRSQAPTG